MEASEPGNLASGGGRSPIWDAENRITSIGTAQFAYDAFGERIKKSSASGTSLYPFGDDYEITSSGGTTTTTKYVSVLRVQLRRRFRGDSRRVPDWRPVGPVHQHAELLAAGP
jgi:hypothetical protein